ncbi:UNVERIFIED_CONTAM: Endoplasmic reticulum resident protein 44.2, partial [Eudyptes robustus]
ILFQIMSYRLFLWLLTVSLPLVYVHGNTVTQLTMENLDPTLKSAQVVFVAFCADWCPFSRRLKPIFEESAAAWYRDNPQSSVVWALVDSVAQANVADKYAVTKYPTMKIFVNGELILREYRGSRSVEALTAFVKQHLQTSIQEFGSIEQLNAGLDKSKRNVIGYFHCRDCPEYRNFQKAAALYREDCAFWSGTNEAIKAMQGNMLVFKDPSTESDIQFSGKFADFEFVKEWIQDKCIPLVREVTFENVEELTEEGLPFLIFFRDPANKNDDKFFTELVMREIPDQRIAINALLADGHKFAHPLKHLGKTAKDLPVLAIDSFQHMFLFPNMSELNLPGKLRQFVQDLQTGKLHKEFHETLDQRVAELQKTLEQQQIEGEPRPPGQIPVDTTLKPSIFKELKPSDKRYSILQKTEL